MRCWLMSNLTAAQKRALNWLEDHNGSGVIDRYGYIIAGGERGSKFAAETWLRLAVAGYVTCGDGRISIKDCG